MNETTEHYRTREMLAAHELNSKGWLPLGNFRFFRNGKIFDLSAADLQQLERIESENLFVIG